MSCSLVASLPVYRFLRMQVRWSVIPISLRNFQFVVIHTVKGFSVVNEADVFPKAFLESVFKPVTIQLLAIDYRAQCTLG